MRIIFMGTPKFAVPTLLKLLETQEFEVVAVYTKAPKASGRGMTIIKSPVHILAEAYNIPTVTPKTLRGEEALLVLKKFNADIVVVAAYGIILPISVLEATKHGCINIHPSALPRWRGAAPIQRTIMAGDKRTALCIMKMNEGLDTGDVILRHDIDIPDNITAFELEDIMAKLGSENLMRALQLIRTEQATFEKQAEDGATYASKIDKLEEKIDWKKTASEIHYQIRTFSPRPGAHFIYKNEIIKIIEAVIVEDLDNNTLSPGLVIDDKLTIACSSGFIQPTLLQREGRKMLYTDAFLRGFSIKINEIMN